MIETIETGSPTVVGFRLTGSQHDEDYKTFVQTMKTILTAKGKVRLLVEYEDFPGWDLYAAWDEFKLSLPHCSDFERIAMVGDRKWEKLMAGFCEPFTTARVKYFNRSEIDAAWQWLKENEEDTQVAAEQNREWDSSDESDMSTEIIW